MDPVPIEIEMLKQRLNQIEIELCGAVLSIKKDTKKISELYETVKQMNEDIRREYDGEF